MADKRLEITEEMARRRARQLSEKYEGNEGAWSKYVALAFDQLRTELKDARTNG